MIEFVRTRPWINLAIASIALTAFSIMTSTVLFPMSIFGMFEMNTVLEIALTVGVASLYVMGVHTAYIVGGVVSNHWNSKTAPVEQPSSSKALKPMPNPEPTLVPTPGSENRLIIEEYLDEDDIYISRVSGAGIEKTPDQAEDSPISTPQVGSPITFTPSLLLDTPVLARFPASPMTPSLSLIGTPMAISASVLESDFNRTPNVSPLQLTPDSPIGSLSITPVEAPEQTFEVTELDQTLKALHRTVDRAIEVVQAPLVRRSPEILAGTPTRRSTPISEMYTPSDSPIESPKVSRSNGGHRSKAPVLNGFSHKRNGTPTKPCHICSDNFFEPKKYGSVFEEKNGTTVRKSARSRKMSKYS